MAYSTPGLGQDENGNLTWTDRYGVVRLVLGPDGGISYAVPDSAPAPVLSSAPQADSVPAGSYLYQIAWADVATGGYIAAQNATAIVLSESSIVTITIPPIPAFAAGGVDGGSLYSIWRSDDAGTTWGRVTQGADFPTFPDESAILLVSLDGSVPATGPPNTTSVGILNVAGGAYVAGDLHIGNSTIPADPAVLATGAAHNVDDVITLLQSLGLAKQS